MCLEGFQTHPHKNRHCHQEMRPPGDRGRWMFFIRLEQTDGSWRCSWEEASRSNNPAETAAQHLHCCGQFIAQVGGSCGHWKHQQGRKKNFQAWDQFNSISRKGFFRWGDWRREFSRFLTSLGTDITVALTSSAVTSRHILPVSTWRHLQMTSHYTQRDPTRPASEI